MFFVPFRYKLGASQQTDYDTTRDASVLGVQSEEVDSDEQESIAAEDELIRWTAVLDYDDYCLNWTQLATTASSEAATGEWIG